MGRARAGRLSLHAWGWVDAEKARKWIAQGATPSDTVQSLLKQAGVFKAAGV